MQPAGWKTSWEGVSCETPLPVLPRNDLRHPWPDGNPSEETSCHQVGEHHPDEECPGRDAMAVSPAKIAAMVLLGALMALYVLLTSGCASASWKAGLSTNEIDFKNGPSVIPKAEFSLGGAF